MTENLKPFLAALGAGRDLARDEALRAFEILMEGAASPAQMGAFLMALKAKGETATEIAAAARVLRERCSRVACPPEAIDIVGTGGDRSGSVNVSTAAAFIVAGLGIPVAKHGNRSITSKAGAADTLEALGVRIDLGHQGAEHCLREAGICFMLAPVYHSAMRHVANVRAELGVPTIFNLMGPLANPAQVTRLMAGVYDARWQQPYAEVLRELGVESAWIAHGADGLDEITTTGPTRILQLRRREIAQFDITPEEAGLARSAAADLKGGTAAENAARLTQLLAGRRDSYRDVAVLNAAGALVAAGAEARLAQAARLAEESIDSGRARAALDRLVRASND